jgi:hypothetical protein
MDASPALLRERSIPQSPKGQERGFRWATRTKIVFLGIDGVSGCAFEKHENSQVQCGPESMGTRGIWSVVWLDQLLQDVRYGLKALCRNPGFAAIGCLIA